MIFELILIFVLLFVIQGLVYQFMYDIYIPVFILSLTLYICYMIVKFVFYFRKKREIRKESQKGETVKVFDKNTQILKEFIQKNMKEGFQESVIKDALLKRGWPKEKIEQAFNNQ